MAQPKRLVLVLLAAMMPKGAEAAGNPVSGERVFQYCYSCHAVDPNEKATLQGPRLHAIVGKRIAAQTGFDYSLALRAFAERHDVWSEDLLDRYIASPESVVPKTTMNFGGLEDPQERADLIAFLKAQPQLLAEDVQTDAQCRGATGSCTHRHAFARGHGCGMGCSSGP